jgi:hypothetical protein
MAPEHGRVAGALGARKARVDDLKQVGHRSSQAVCTVTLPPTSGRRDHSDEPALWRRRAGRSSAAGSRALRWRDPPVRGPLIVVQLSSERRHSRGA